VVARLERVTGSSHGSALECARLARSVSPFRSSIATLFQYRLEKRFECSARDRHDAEGSLCNGQDADRNCEPEEIQVAMDVKGADKRNTCDGSDACDGTNHHDEGDGDFLAPSHLKLPHGRHWSNGQNPVDDSVQDRGHVIHGPKYIPADAVTGKVVESRWMAALEEGGKEEGDSVHDVYQGADADDPDWNRLNQDTVKEQSERNLQHYGFSEVQ